MALTWPLEYAVRAAVATTGWGPPGSRGPDLALGARGAGSRGDDRVGPTWQPWPWSTATHPRVCVCCVLCGAPGHRKHPQHPPPHPAYLHNPSTTPAGRGTATVDHLP